MRVTLCLLSLLGAAFGGFSCKDQNNEDVDWFYAYKLPELGQHPSPLVNEGYGFMYLDVNNPDKWVLSNTTLESPNTAIGYTLQQYYKNSKREDIFYMLYNDEHPSGSYSSAHAHAKGVMQFDSEAGFWLVHSAPKFPQTGSYAWAQNARRYGQSFLCVTLPYTELNGLGYNKNEGIARHLHSLFSTGENGIAGKQFFQIWPYLYAWNMPVSMAAANSEMAQVLKGQYNKTPPLASHFSLSTSAGTKFTQFAKERYWGKDLYYDYVAPIIDVPLYTETWMNGGGNLTSDCNKTACGASTCPAVHNVLYITLPDGVDFSDHHDHSKVAVSADPTQPWICVGDINRQHGQLKRGGGTLCQYNNSVWTAYYRSITKTESCKV